MQDFTTPPSFNQYNVSPATLAVSSEAVFFQKVYLWMCGGLGLTALVAYGLSTSVAWREVLARSSGLFILIVVAQLGLVFGMSILINKVSSTALKFMFMLYAVTVGLTFSVVLMVYPTDLIFKAFVSTAAVYGAMATYGLVTRRSLQAWGKFLFMALIGLGVSMVINWFAKSPMVDYVICWGGVIVFAALTAYDHQKLRVMYASGFSDSENEGKVVIMGALNLYLDFINLFMFILRILAASRD